MIRRTLLACSLSVACHLALAAPEIRFIGPGETVQQVMPQAAPPPTQSKSGRLRAWPPPRPEWQATTRLNLQSYSDEILLASSVHGLDPSLLRAIIHAESGFNPDAVSPAGAQGLMQLMPATATRFGVADAFEPSQNIDGGARYLAFLIDRFDADFALAVAAYNAGEGAVDRHGGIPPYKETLTYVDRVDQLFQRYRDAASAPLALNIGAEQPQQGP